MQKQHAWLLDLGKVSTESESSAARPTAQSEGAAAKKNAVRSPTQVLAQLDFLKNLHLPQIKKILKLCTVGTYQTEQDVHLFNAPSDEMYILISGELAVLTQDGAQALNIYPVTTVGELGFITQSPRPIGLKATEPSKVLHLSRFQFDRLLRSDTDMQVKVYRNIIDILSGRLFKLRDIVEGALVNCNDPREDT